jgi:F-type H+-transporting ATPase subunit epsilon
MNAGQLFVRIVTPEGMFIETRADLVELPTLSGEIGIYPNHESMVTALGAGEVRLHHSDETDAYAVAGGYAQIGASGVTLIASFASAGEEAAAIEAAKARARASLEQSGMLSSEDIDAEVTAVEAELVRLAELSKLRGRPRRSIG